jgi:hypothetical protein
LIARRYYYISPDNNIYMAKTTLLTYKTPIIIVCCLIFIASCKKDGSNGIDYRPNIAIPIVKSSFTIKDILSSQQNSNNIIVGSDGFINLVYTAKLFSKKAEDIIIIDNQKVNYGFKLNTTQANAFNVLPTGQQFPTINIPQSFPLQLDSASLDTIALKAGLIHLKLQSSMPCDFNLSLNLPEVRKNNLGMTISLQRTYNNTLPIVIDTIIDISNYIIGLTNNGTQQNALNANLSFSLKKGVNPINANDSIGVRLDFEDLKFKRIYGKFNDFVLTPEPDTVDISIFQTAMGLGTINVDNPKLTTRIKNSFGVRIDASFNIFQGYNEKLTPSTIDFSGSGVPNPLAIQSPSALGQSTLTQFSLDKLNSNITNIINSQPSAVIYKLQAKTSTINSGFILDTSRFDVEMEVDLPLSGSINNFIFRDTVDYKFDKGDKIESILFRTNITNGFPFETGIQVYFADSSAQVIDSLVKDKAYELLLSAAPVDATGKVVSGANSYKQSNLKLDAATIAKLTSVQKFIIEGRVSSTNQGLMRIYDNYKLDVQLGVKAKLKL